jgi:hypothetical protein
MPIYDAPVAISNGHNQTVPPLFATFIISRMMTFVMYTCSYTASVYYVSMHDCIHFVYAWVQFDHWVMWNIV